MAQKPLQSYTELYFELIQEISQADLGQYISRWIKNLVFLGWLLVGLVFILNPKQWLAVIMMGFIITLFFVCLGIFFWLVYIAWSGSQDPLRRVKRLVAQLLISVSRPHSQCRGLRKKELQHLQQVAVIEQSAADWRGNFVNLVIVGLFLGTLSFILQPPAFVSQWQVAASSVAQTPIQLNIPWADWTLPPALTTGSNVFSFTVSISMLLLVLIQLGRYLAKFLSSESPNRILLFACTEALALLEANGLGEREAFTIPEKRYLARQFGYDFHSRSCISALLYIDDLGRGWYLEPLDPSPLRKRVNWLIQWIWQWKNFRQAVSLDEEE